MSKRKPWTPRPDTGNSDMAAAMLGKRLSSAAGKHQDKRDKRCRTRAAHKERAMKDYS